uniref:hypothetical protein n=1 Tax=uncultured Sphingomonas sp. TaxID=158754 RepID=UPI0035CBF56D
MKPQSTSLIAALMALGAGGFSAQAKVSEGMSLNSTEIRKALVGKSIRYRLSNGSDMGMYEEFHSNGVWSGARSGRGPWQFSGRWLITDNEICVTAKAGTSYESSYPGQHCRKIWRDRKTGALRTGYPYSSSKLDLQTLKVADLAITD